MLSNKMFQNVIENNVPDFSLGVSVAVYLLFKECFFESRRQNPQACVEVIYRVIHNK